LLSCFKKETKKKKDLRFNLLQIGELKMSHYKIQKRYDVERMVHHFIEKNQLRAIYGKDTEGIFQVNFLVEEGDVPEPDEVQTELLI